MTSGAIRRGARVMLLAACGAIFASGFLAYEQPTIGLAAPAATVSRYEKTVDTTTVGNQGCAAAGTTGAMILNFGQPWYQGGTYGTWNWSNQFFSIAQIQGAMKAWLSQYYLCGGTDVKLAIGTSNNFGYTGSAHASAWATMVNAINAWIASPPSWLNVEQARGAIDAEVEWSSASVTEPWAQEYASIYSCTNSCSYYYDEGDAGGCPPAGSHCNGGWTQHDVYYMAWASPPAYPFPEIYWNPPPGGPINAQQWQAINALYPMSFLGVLTEHAADGNSNTPAQGWQQLATATSQSPSYSSDITWAN